MKTIRGIVCENKNKIIKSGGKILVIFALFLMPNIVNSTSLDQQIQDAETKLNQTTAQKNTLAGQVAAFDSQIYASQLQINSTSAEINRLSSEISNTESKIKQAEADLAKAQDQLKEIIRVSYEDGQVSNIELIAKSNNFSDFINRSEYMDSVQLKIKDITGQIVSLKNELATKKQALETDRKKQEETRAEQLAAKAAIDSQRAAKNFILQQTKGQEGSYQSLLKNLYAERAAAAAASGSVNTGGGGCGGGYPCYGGIDPWGFYGRQCTSYAAWYSAGHGPVSSAVLSDWGHGHIANGGNWAGLGISHGYPVSGSPHIGSIAVWPIGSLTSPSYYDVYGHVAIVTGVSGGTISVSEYNFIYPEAYGTRSNVPISWRNNYTGGYYSLSFIN